MSKVLCSLVLTMSLGGASVEAQVIGGYEWEFEEEDGACYAGVLSFPGGSRFQLSVERDRISGFIISKDSELEGLLIDGKVTATGFFDSGDYVEFGEMVLVGRKPFEVGKSEDWAWLMFVDPNRTGDRRMLFNENLTVYIYGIRGYSEGYPLDVFPLNGFKEAVTRLAGCAQ